MKVINKPEIYFSMDLCDCPGYFRLFLIHNKPLRKHITGVIKLNYHKTDACCQ